MIEFPAEDCSTRLLEAHALKERLAHTALVLGTAIRELVDDLSDILVH